MKVPRWIVILSGTNSLLTMSRVPHINQGDLAVVNNNESTILGFLLRCGWRQQGGFLITRTDGTCLGLS